MTAVRTVRPSSKRPRFAAGFLDEAQIGDGDGAIHRLHHVVDGEARHRRRGEGFHLHPGLVHGAHAGLHRDGRGAGVEREGHVDAGDAERVAEGDEIGRALGGQDARGAGDAEHVALGHLARAHRRQRRGLDLQGRAGDRLTGRFRLGGNVHHPRVPRGGEVGEAAEARAPREEPM
jgi:hypothetical protein